MAESIDDVNHSRACGPVKHPHGVQCHSNCPTCDGKAGVVLDNNIWELSVHGPISAQGDEFFHSAMPGPVFDKDSTPVKKAIRTVFNYIKPRLERTDTHVTFSEDEVYVVWFNFTLGNWKALVSTTLPDGMYYEVTYNRDKGEMYLDAYKKFDNVCYTV